MKKVGKGRQSIKPSSPKDAHPLTRTPTQSTSDLLSPPDQNEDTISDLLVMLPEEYKGSPSPGKKNGTAFTFLRFFFFKVSDQAYLP